jgi:hypothetical protein
MSKTSHYFSLLKNQQKTDWICRFYLVTVGAHHHTKDMTISLVFIDNVDENNERTKKTKLFSQSPFLISKRSKTRF